MYALSSYAMHRLSEFGAQDISIMLWAFAKLEFGFEPLMSGLSRRLLDLVADFICQDLAITAWACAKLVVGDAPLLNAISEQAIQKIPECTPQNVSNLAWAWSTMAIPNEPLLSAIAAAAIFRMSEFNPQNIANTAWSFARLVVRDEPLMQAISKEVLRKIPDFVGSGRAPECYSVIWSMWRTHHIGDVRSVLERGIDAGLVADALVQGLLLSDCEWRGDGGEERRIQASIGQSMPMSALRWILLDGDVRATVSPTLAFESLYHMYRRLSKCVDHVSAGMLHSVPVADPQPAIGRSNQVILRIESFGQDIGQWLKVAGGDKASVTEDALLRRALRSCEVSVEFGAFVGYSGIRFARCILSGPGFANGGWAPAGISLEVDPVHSAVARHFIDLACLSNLAEVWSGLLQDTLPLLSERTGEACKGFGFMDQRGTTFHDDLAQMERLRSLAPLVVVTADNVNKPGAPVFLWNMTRSLQFDTVVWSMGEFASDAVEDWQSVSVGRSGPNSPPGARPT